MNALVFTVFGISVSVKNIIGGVILAAIFALFAYWIGFVFNSGNGVKCSVLKNVLTGTVAIMASVGIVSAIFWLVKFIGYCFS